MSYTEGTTVYSEDGRQYTYLASITAGHVVLPVYETPDGDGHYEGDPIVVERVFSEPITPRIHAEVAELDRKLAERRQKMDELRKEEAAFAVAEKERLARLKQHQCLKRLDDFLAGRITHFVLQKWSGVVIMTKEECLKTADEWNRNGKELKLLSLFGKSNGDLQFRVNQYSDGSGTYTDATPFCSEKEATEYAKQLIIAQLEEAIPNATTHSCDRLLEDARRLGVPIPAALEDAQRKRATEILAQQAAELEKKLSEVKAKREAISA